jgi:hypothetical protein
MKYCTKYIDISFVQGIIEELDALHNEVAALPWFLERQKELSKRLHKFMRTNCPKDWQRVREYIMRFSLKEIY